MTTRFRRIATLVALGVFAFTTLAAELRAGRFEADAGRGELTLTKTPRGMHFAIEALGANGHSCSLDGDVHDGVGTTEDEGSGVCRIAIRPKDGGYEVESLTDEACRVWCGARASFDAVYRPMPAGCSEPRYDARRAAFLKLYRAGRYAAALDAAQALRRECGRYRGFVDVDSLANDIAITQFHLGRPADCIATLKKTTAWGADSVDAVRDGLPPVEAESYAPVARATFTNRKRCEDALKSRR